MSRLLLFTNDYPYRTGDVVFVEKEIDALAAQFDDVVVFCHARDTSNGMVDLPDGVRLGGNLFVPEPEDAPRRLVEPASLLLLANATWRELWSGRLLRHAKLFLMGAKVGITQAHRTAVREAIAGDPDTVAYGFWAMGGGLGVPWLRGVRRRVVRVHRYDLYEDQAIGGYLPYRPFLFARADRILAISRDAQAYLESHYRETAGKVALSRLGAHGPATPPARLPHHTRTIVSCSAVSEVKRVSLILDVVRGLASLDPDRPIRWVHFGDGPLMPTLQASLADLPDSLQVELRGQVPNSEIAAFYASGEADAFVNLSSSEGVPVSIMEAIAYGVPVLATDVGGSSEIVGPELRTGELVASAASPSAITATLSALLTAEPGHYAPRTRWEQDYDARRTGAIAAELVASSDQESSPERGSIG
ncbi:glycosyltransferase [Microbacterium saperdae]